MSEKAKKKAGKGRTVEVEINLGELQPLVQKAARWSGVSVEEYVIDALQSCVMQAQEEMGRGRENFTPHGGKHKYGKYSGYEVTGDGRYYPAPMWTQQFEQIFAERQAIINLANSIVSAAQERLVTVEKALYDTKNKLVAELGLDPSKSWGYYPTDGGYLQEVKETDESANDTK